MTEYWVSHKRMNADKTRIIQVRAMIKREGGGLSTASTYPRQNVVDSIENDNDWYTCEETRENHYCRRAEIHIIEVRGTKFIRTDGNQTESDNLGELPEF